MNIFAVHHDPCVAATQLCDKHVVKMIVEGCQMLSTNHRLSGSHVVYTLPVKLYKQAFQNHPCTVWARHNKENYMWLAEHTLELCYEYRRRYGKTHACEIMSHWFTIYYPLRIPDGDLTPFAQAMPDEFKVPNDSVAAYRKYYIGAKAKIAKWKFTNPPDWYTEGLTNAAVLV
jgi:hypothetical protein